MISCFASLNSGRFAALLVAMSLAACGPVIIPVSWSDGGMDLDECSASAPCPAEAYCNRPNCGAPRGTCEVKPVQCDAIFLPVCGCDNVTYLNICRLRQAGVPLLQVGECMHAPGCDQNHSCPTGAYCGRINPEGQCGAATHGRCWNVPASCPAAPGAFISCSTSKCVDLCAAFRSPDVFTPTANDTCP